ncbi:MAG: DNA methyltransferase [Chloroflexota bacterium]
MFSIHSFLNQLIHDNCIQVMQTMPSHSIDLIVTDPPYLVNYRSRDGRTIAGDQDDAWLHPAFAEMYRVLTPNSLCISFYGWNKVDRFMDAWRTAGFMPVGHFTWSKPYASSQGFTQARHENAYLLAKGNPRKPAHPPRDVLPWHYTGNRLHPTQKPVSALTPLIEAYSTEGAIILDPFAGSGTTAVAARQLHRAFIGIEMDRTYFVKAKDRLAKHSAS